MLKTHDYNRLKLELRKSVKRHHSDTLLLSGGLDSSILAVIARPSQTITVVWDENSPDLRFAREMARRQKTIHTEVSLNKEEYLSEVLKEVIRSLRTFSPMEVRNSVVSCAGLMTAKHLGYENVMTGDGCDELFVGYKYLARYFEDLDKLEEETKRLWKIMQFSSRRLSETFGIELRTPYLDQQFLDYAKSIPLSQKIGEHLGEHWGKYNLRLCFLQELGYDFAWRNKMAQEHGAGTTKLRTHFENNYDSSTFRLKTQLAQRESVNLSNKEQLRYYEIFRSYFCPPVDDKCSDCRCPTCSACINYCDTYCRICGSFPIVPIKLSQQ